MSADARRWVSIWTSLDLRSSAVICGVFLLGCSGYTGPRSVVNEDPAVKIPEIRNAVARGDKSVMPHLVNDLDNDDPAVRLYAIGALQRLSGQNFEYDWTEEDRAARRPAIETWRAYVEGTAAGENGAK